LIEAIQKVIASAFKRKVCPRHNWKEFCWKIRDMSNPYWFWLVWVFRIWYYLTLWFNNKNKGIAHILPPFPKDITWDQHASPSFTQ
jgi:hypothetical protein